MPSRRGAILIAWMMMALAACRVEPPAPVNTGNAPSDADPVASALPPSPPLVAAARRQIGVVRHYDPAYFSLAYPGGDVPADRGVCTDVVIRTLRTQGLDLQQLIHEDMRANFAAYPRDWGLSRPDRSIDHRRVPNQMRWFERHGWNLPIGERAGAFAAGDIVAWKLAGSGLLHVGIVSDRKSAGNIPLIIHNIGAGTQEEDLLFDHPIIGHYRPPHPL
ncbi:DUF1287 domain-containing protein [Pseudoxanthomonas putridarboris]|uniref:DUF1287 domain-containing protein n=1 Tax=Pseudoxanthomonas putridarboris TaxID=752605 RepID=A0ABU9J4G3_9GAMM